MKKAYSIVLSGAVALAAMVGVSSTASATPVINSPTSVTIDEVGDSFTVHYLCEAGELCRDDQAAEDPLTAIDMLADISYTVASTGVGTGDFDGLSMITFDVAIDNNTQTTFNAMDVDAFVTAFGIDVTDPALLGASTNGAGWDAGANVGSAGFGQVAFCAWVGANCQGGSASDGVAAGGSAAFQVSLFLDSGFLLTDGLTMSTFFIKFQGVPCLFLAGKCEGEGLQNAGSYEFTGTLWTDTNDIPEPGTLGILGMGLLGMAAMGRRRRRAA